MVDEGVLAAGDAEELRDFALAMWVQLGEVTESFESRIRELEAENQQLMELIHQQNESLSYYPNSLSWRVTAPLRAIRKNKS